MGEKTFVFNFISFPNVDFSVTNCIHIKEYKLSLNKKIAEYLTIVFEIFHLFYVKIFKYSETPNGNIL